MCRKLLTFEFIFMHCPFCHYNDTKVVDSRETDEGKIVRRRRECLKCSVRFSTYEEVEPLRTIVVKKDGSKAAFDKKKIEIGILKALERRPFSSEKFAKLLSAIEYQIEARGKQEITTKEIGKIVLKNLLKFDEVAYVRFASVYKSFTSIKSFQKELDQFDA